MRVSRYLQFRKDRLFSFGCRHLNIVGDETVYVKSKGYNARPDQGVPNERKNFIFECPTNQVLTGVSAE